MWGMCAPARLFTRGKGCGFTTFLGLTVDEHVGTCPVCVFSGDPVVSAHSSVLATCDCAVQVT